MTGKPAASRVWGLDAADKAARLSESLRGHLEVAVQQDESADRQEMYLRRLADAHACAAQEYQATLGGTNREQSRPGSDLVAHALGIVDEMSFADTERLQRCIQAVLDMRGEQAGFADVRPKRSVAANDVLTHLMEASRSLGQVIDDDPGDMRRAAAMTDLDDDIHRLRKEAKTLLADGHRLIVEGPDARTAREELEALHRRHWEEAGR